MALPHTYGHFDDNGARYLTRREAREFLWAGHYPEGVSERIGPKGSIIPKLLPVYVFQRFKETKWRIGLVALALLLVWVFVGFGTSAKTV
jgi:hypothetical protein